jgi:ABC-type nickel/cobalt efflux system permease component RcnA
MRERSILNRIATLIAATLAPVVAVLIIIAPLAGHAEVKPPSAFGPAAQSTQPAPPSAFAPQPGYSLSAQGGILGWVLTTQQRLQRDLATGVKSLKGDNALAGAVMLAALSFLYGVVHAVGPGHGKAIISSYVVANEETVRRGIIISFIAAGVQALTAVALVSVLAVVFNATGLQINAWSNQLESVSYALIALVGAWLLAGQLLRLYRRRQSTNGAEAAHVGHDHHHDHAHAHSNEPAHVHAHVHALAHAHDHSHTHGHAHAHAGHDHDHSHADGEACSHMVDARELAGPFSWRKAIAVVLSVGVRPCTGAILVLIFALTQGLFWAGIAAAFAMALGTAITVAVLASLALGSRQLALRLGGENSAWANGVWTACAIGGSAFILLSGAVLFAASLGPARPF